MHLVCMGQGGPTVILASGGGGNLSLHLEHWSSPASPRPRASARGIAPGLGMSSPSPAKQTVDETTRDLEAALQAAGIAGPYVIVGHSTGGFDSLVFADRHPSEVVGMVLVDPTPLPGQKRAGETPVIDEILAAHPPPWVTALERCAASIRAGTLKLGGPDPDHCLEPPPPPPDYPPALAEALNGTQGGRIGRDDRHGDGQRRVPFLAREARA